MERIRIVVVGLGHRGRHMAKLAARGFDCTDVVGVCDIDRDMWCQKQWDQDKPMAEILPEPAFYQDYLPMLEELKPDLAIVETGADIHAEFCCQALDRGIHVLSDIPVVASLAEAGALWRSAQAARGVMMVGANPNEAGWANALVDLHQRGLLGEPYYMEAEYIHWSEGAMAKNLTEHSEWRRHLSPIRYSTHSLGPLLRILREDLRHVSCFGTGLHCQVAEGMLHRKDDMQAAQFRTESGVVVRLLRNGACRARIGHHSYRVFCTKGYFEKIAPKGGDPVKIRFNSDVLYGARQLTSLPLDEYMPPEYASNPRAVGHGGVDYAMLDKLFAALLAGTRAVPTDLREGLRMTLPGIYAEESARRHGEVLTMHYPWDAEWKTSF